MFILRYLIFIFIISYVFWYISNHFLHKQLSLAKVIAYSMVGLSSIGLALWLLSVLVEGL